MQMLADEILSQLSVKQNLRIAGLAAICSRVLNACWWEFEIGSIDHGLGGLDGFALDLICENPSDPPNPWSIHLATHIQDTTRYA